MARTLKIRTTGLGLAAALGAGLASALLAMMPALKTPGTLMSIGDLSPSTAVAFGLAFVASLPLMLAALAFGWLSGLVAAVVGTIAVGLVDLRPDAVAVLHLDKLATGGFVTLVFVVGVAAPSWLLARIALRPTVATSSGDKPRARPEEQRLGLVVAVAVAFAAAGAAVSIAAAGRGSLREFLQSGSATIEPMLTSLSTLPKGVDAHSLAVAIVWAGMAVMAAGQLMLISFNLWLAARIVQMSGLLSIPWPDIPSGLRVPRPLAILLAVALGLSFAGNELGAIGVIVSGALGMAFAFQGLAVVHAVTRGTQGMRLPLLIIVYLTLFFLRPWNVAAYGLLGLLGLLDTAFCFRDRLKPIVKKNP